MTPAELEQILKKGHCKINGVPFLGVKENKSRVFSRKTEADGHLFDSKAEAEIYCELKIDPAVKMLQFQPCFELQPAFERNGKKYRSIKYTADFRIIEYSKMVIVEVKSAGTIKANSKSYPMRRKMFLKKFPDLFFREIIFDGTNRTVKEY